MSTASRPPLRPVGADERRKKPNSIADAAENFTDRDILEQMRDRIAKALDAPNTLARDLASLSKRLMEIQAEIAAIDSREGGDDIGDAAATADEAFRPEAL